MSDNATFGVYLKKLRESRNLKISSLAKKSGVSTSYISRIQL
ncbi:MAG: helix-turn-helix domain-containing protein [Halanaerobiales bacterium]|nr:helix-turn-helix domain-containing protein [Halanaerobiales bacterium]